MIDEKKLIEDLAKEACTLYVYDSSGDCQEYEAVNGLHFGSVMELIGSQPKIGEWIPCSERLPEVEVSERTKVGICSDNGENFLITDTEGYVYESTFYAVAQKFEDDAVAWQPLPEAYHDREVQS